RLRHRARPWRHDHRRVVSRSRHAVRHPVARRHVSPRTLTLGRRGMRVPLGRHCLRATAPRSSNLAVFLRLLSWQPGCSRIREGRTDRRRVMKIDKVLVPLDGSKLAEQALTKALDVAEGTKPTFVLLRAAEATTWPGGDPADEQVRVVR